MILNIEGVSFLPGDRVTCCVERYGIRHEIDGHIYFNEPSHFWLCHDIPSLNGSESPDKIGHIYSWLVNINVRTGSISSREVSDFRHDGDSLVRKDAIIDEDLLAFFYSNGYHDFLNIFRYKIDLFDEFSEYSISENQGFIVLKNDNKNMEIKLGRFVRQMALNFNTFLYKTPFKKMEITDRIIEEIHNKFIAYQSDKSTNFEFLSGEDILRGYSSEMYYNTSGVSGTIHKSCMTDHSEFLKLYTKNPNQIKLAVLKINNGIAARCLVWTNMDGKQFFDRIYHHSDWMEHLIIGKLNKLGIKSLYAQSGQVVKLDNWKFDKYPYLDGFYYFNDIDGLLFYNGNLKSLRSTEGHLN